METTQDQAPATAEQPAASAPATDVVDTTEGQGQQQPGEATEQPPKVEEAAPQQPPKPSRLQQRIDDLTRQRYEAERAKQELEARVAHYERQQALQKQFAELDAEAPQIDQFDSLHAYNMALSNWTTKRATAIAAAQWEERMQKVAAEQAQQSEQAQRQQLQTQRENMVIETKMAAGVKKYPDFQQAIMNPELPTVRGTPLFDIILSAEHAEDVAYSLAKKPGELERLLSMHPLHAAREVFRLDTQFAGTGGATSAPPPPPSRNGSSVTQKSRDSMSFAEWEKWREEDEKASSR